MATKKLKIALYQHVQYKFYSVWHAREDDLDRDPPDYARISEWVEVDFQLLPNDVMQMHKQRETDAVRARLQKQLAELDKEDGT